MGQYLPFWTPIPNSLLLLSARPAFFLSIQYRFVWNTLLPFTDGNIYPIQLSLSDTSHHIQEAAFIETVTQYQEGHSMGIRHQQQASPVSKTDAVISIFHSCCRQAWKTSWAVYRHTETAADVQSGRLKLLHRITEKEGQHERHNWNSRTATKKIFFTAAMPAIHGSWCSSTLSVEIHWNRFLLNRKQFHPDGWKLAAQNSLFAFPDWAIPRSMLK